MNKVVLSKYKEFLDEDNPGLLCAWFNIILFFVFIFPLGLYAYWKRCKADKTTYLHTWKLVLAFGAILFITGLRIFLATGGAIVNVILGIAVLIVAVKMRNTAILRLNIIEALIIHHKNNITDISEMLKKNERLIHLELDAMIKKGMLPGAVIDYERNLVVIPGVINSSSDNNYEPSEDAVKEEEIDTQEEADDWDKSDSENEKICSCCGAELTEEAITNKKCQVCGRIFD